MPAHPPCGLYRTTRALGELPAGRLVNFHNHGDPGPGIYLPRAWALNEAQWHERGTTTDDASWTSTLQPLAAQGLYVVSKTFSCCAKRCVTYAEGQLVQLGYDAAATPILFIPEWTAEGLAFPEQGTVIDADKVGALKLLSVARSSRAPRPSLMH